ncbi:winged helix DNA-binding domain-containing protein [Streptomonospora wellingtoniae]|uniref:Winged helix DNA-binding domain-containing protein n=1 Tax=Streptomonospora wellingtoniae TaxID=3075544 RepID=A0ABU2L137_9ACTN|nr:winged helix DNA-binding domain-containing protein [Streptomonospora sp. DSM 45055]MDT0305250.1 winged helix DNA-binding domain-containing protein [Streptomonospora sp. DSM 45055]
MPLAVDDGRLRAARMHAQLLMGPPAAGVVGAVRGAAALQAQDAQALRLAIRARTSGLTTADVRSAVAEERSIVRTWAMRGTLHALPASDAGWIVDLLGPVFVRRFRRRRLELGLDDELCERAEYVIRDVLAGGTCLTRERLVEELNKADVPVPADGQAPAHLMAYAAMRGVVCRGPDTSGGDGGEPTYVLMREWVGAWEGRDTGSALAKLARRYLWGYGPAGLEDFAAWSGLPAPMARRGWELVASEVAEVTTDRGPAWAPREFAEVLPAAGPTPALRLIGAFDACLLGYRGRDLAVPQRYKRQLAPGGGIVHPAVLVDGRAVARWRWGHGRESVVVEPFEHLSAELLGQVDAEAADIGRFLRGERLRLDVREAAQAE